MTIAFHAVTAEVTVDGDPQTLHNVSGSVTLDEGWSPYAQARLSVAMPAQDVFDALDPRDASQPRVLITATRDVPSIGLHQTRTFDLMITDRVLSHRGATVDISLASDEAKLQDGGLVSTTSNTDALAKQSSVRAIVNDVVLSTIGATLEPGTADADFTTLTAVTNLITNPSAEVNATDWTAGGGCTIARSTAQKRRGLASLLATATGTGLAVYATNTATFLPVTPGKTYTGAIWALPNAAGMSMTVTVRFLDASNNVLSNATGVAVALPLGGWTMGRSASAIAPVNAARVTMYASVTGTAAGRLTYLDTAILTEGDGYDTDGLTPLDFDGSIPDTALYNYDWTGTPSNSTSTRTPVFQRDPQTLSVEPGESWWAFLSPVLEQAGLRLFCDELRVWRLVDSSYTVDGRVTIANGYNVYDASDTVSLTANADDGTPLWFDAVVLKYTWNDGNNVQQVRYDIAGSSTPTRVYRRDLARPYPGPGAAAYILARVAGQGRVLDLRAALDLNATPGMEAVATLPLTPIQTGRAASIRWDFGSDDMQVGTRGLIDTPPAAWLFLPPGEDWLDSPVGASWISETV